MRLRAEYFFSSKQYQKSHCDYTSGYKNSFSHWLNGYRPRVKGNRVTRVRTSRRPPLQQLFRAYLQNVYIYSGTYSLSREMVKVRSTSNIRIGDVFIQGGFPGHAVIVVDMATHQKTGKKIFLLAQSYMPAQELHVLKNYKTRLSPWYEIPRGTLHTPEWKFAPGHALFCGE